MMEKSNMSIMGDFLPHMGTTVSQRSSKSSGSLVEGSTAMPGASLHRQKGNISVPSQANEGNNIGTDRYLFTSRRRPIKPPYDSSYVYNIGSLRHIPVETSRSRHKTTNPQASNSTTSTHEPSLVTAEKEHNSKPPNRRRTTAKPVSNKMTVMDLLLNNIGTDLEPHSSEGKQIDMGLETRSKHRRKTSKTRDGNGETKKIDKTRVMGTMEPVEQTVVTHDTTVHISPIEKSQSQNLLKSNRKLQLQKELDVQPILPGPVCHEQGAQQTENIVVKKRGRPVTANGKEDGATTSVRRGKYKRNTKLNSDHDGGEAVAEYLHNTKRVKKKDTVLNALHTLNLCRLNTPIPAEAVEPITEADIVISGSLDEHEFDCYCCDSDIMSIQELKEQLGANNSVFLSKCHLCIDADGQPCWCCCYIDVFGSLAQKRFVIDVLGFQLAEELAERSRENAEMLFHMLWIQQNKKQLDCNIPDNASNSVLLRFNQLKNIIMHIDRIGLVASQMRRAIEL
ncbi:GCN5-related N-acetyltransferase, putative [Babesia ovis]|uniref:GCN5-related N-acetyltransferase, putative n=1 Tax=Babesia ovis TaxID=5869 RepID=A0A9W5TCK7_BABOV|nr:GCN5-related N-acetyltransferase, putative [Babesia ovis]